MSNLLTIQQAAELLQVSVGAMNTWRQKGTGPPFHRLGDGPKAPIRYDPGDIAAWLEARKVGGRE